MRKRLLETADFVWRDEQTPVSSRFDDVYFSVEDGCRESQYVFIEQNRLPQRFADFNGSHFTVAETGFGTGLNFLNCWSVWRQHCKPGQKLYFISAELYPLGIESIQRSHRQWPQFADLSQQLLAAYPAPVKGMHTLELGDGVTLILLFDDATAGFRRLLENHHPALSCDKARAVDAWFLDGFAPGKNESLWQPALFQLMASSSRPGTSVATFSAAGIVKRGLRSNGFAVSKVAGFGKKRDMLTAEYRGLPDNSDPAQKPHGRQAMPFWPVYRKKRPYRSVVVIGAGIAGCTTAHTLSEAGMQVTLIDRHNRPLQQASGNPQAVLYPKLSLGDDAFAEFNLLSMLYAWRYYRQAPWRQALSCCGLLQLIDTNNAAKARQLADAFAGADTVLQYLPASRAQAIAGTALDHDALYYPQAGWLDTAGLGDAFMQAGSFRFIGNCPVTAIEKTNEGWQIQTATDNVYADAVVLCNADAANSLLAAHDRLPIQSIRGQVSYLDQAPAEIRTVICHEGYICPKQNGKPYTFGASFDLKDNSTTLSECSQQQNINALTRYLPDFAAIDRLPLQGRVGFRATSPDYMPLIGPLPDHQRFLNDYRDYQHNAKAYIPRIGTYQDGLFVNIGYGSRGFSSAPIGAALLRSYLLGQPWPLPCAVNRALNPARFLIKAINRTKTG